MTKAICSIYVVLFSICMGMAQDSPAIKATLKVEETENSLTFKPIVENLGELYLEYNYLLLVKKTDAQNNLSLNRQNGKFTLNPGEVKTLSILELNRSKKQNIKAYLYIRDEEENLLITKDSVEVSMLQQRHIQVEETSLLMEGLVVDESKTKFGKDFYDEFFSIYNQYPNKFKFIVTITEMPFRGLTSIVQIKANQETIYEFLSNPNEEYAKQQVNVTLQRLAQYANVQKLQQNINY